MTPKEKAHELAHKMFEADYCGFKHHFCNCEGGTWHQAKQCALIAVDEIIEATKKVVDRPDFNGIVFDSYWIQVKSEIQAL